MKRREVMTRPLSVEHQMVGGLGQHRRA